MGFQVICQCQATHQWVAVVQCMLNGRHSGSLTVKDRTEMKRALGKLIIVEVNLPEKASDEKCGLAGSNSSPRQENTALGFCCTGW